MGEMSQEMGEKKKTWDRGMLEFCDSTAVPSLFSLLWICCRP